jgi:hypothetical protein
LGLQKTWWKVKIYSIKDGSQGGVGSIIEWIEGNYKKKCPKYPRLVSELSQSMFITWTWHFSWIYNVLFLASPSRLNIICLNYIREGTNGIEANCLTQERRFTLIRALSSNPINSTFELNNSHSSIVLPPCVRLPFVSMLKNHMGASPIK